MIYKPSFVRPRVVISRCLNFEACRYNAQVISDAFIRNLMPHVEVVTVCPEVAIALGVPRDPIRLVKEGDKLHLRQPATGRDVTSEMNSFSAAFLSDLDQVEGFILKSRSPTCGIKDVKVYAANEARGSFEKDVGLFGKAVLQSFPHCAIEDEGRLRNFRIREHFLTKLFLLARFQELSQHASMKALVDFHSRQKFLLMAYNQRVMARLGRIAANQEKRPVMDVLNDYRNTLTEAFVKLPRYTSHINVLMHGLGYFSEGLSKAEKHHFLEVLEDYRAGRVPLSQPRGIMQSWIVRFNESYLAEQNYFQPYPADLIEITDSGKGRGE